MLIIFTIGGEIIVSTNTDFENKALINNDFENKDVDSKTGCINWLIDNLPVTVFRASSKLSWGMDYISKNVEKLTGYSKSDFIDHRLSWIDIVYPEDFKIIDKAVKNAKKTESSYQIEYRIKKSDGSTAYIQEKAHLVCDDTGEPAYIAGMFLDLTSEAKQRENSHDLANEEERIQLEMFRSFVERISIGEEIEKVSENFTGDTKKTVDLINRSIETIMGILDEIKLVSKARKEGHLSIRADDSKYSGEWRTVLGEFNNAFDAVIDPLNDVTEYVGCISRGEIPKPITDDYKGDFNEIKSNLNACIDGLQGLVECNSVLHQITVNNDLSKGVEGKYVGIFAAMSEATNNTRDRLLFITKLMNDLAVGNTSELEGLKKIGKRSEQDRLLPAFIGAMENINLLIEDTEMLTRAAVEGKLDTRADASKHQGEYKKVVQGINDTLDAVICPLNVAAEYVERISHGDIPEPITDDHKGDFNEIKNNLNTCITAVNRLIEDSLMLSEAGVAGRYDIRADITRHEGDFSKIISGFNETLDAIVTPMNAAIEDSLMLSEAAVAGRLDIRADVIKHTGNFREIISGFNDTLDAVIGPLNVAAEYIERISRGEIPEPITDNYNGDFNEIKNNLNNCIEGLQGLVECNNVLHRLAVNDHTKGVEGKYIGIFASMGEATNEVLDRLLSVTNLMNDIAVGDTSRLAEFKRIGKRSEQDDLMPSFIQVMENIDLLIEDAKMLSRTAIEGKLDTRADVSKHHGEYREIIQGVNDTLDSVIGPLNVAAEYVERISRGDIPEPITDKYNGDFNEIKNNLNTCIVAVNRLIEDSLMLSEAGVLGKLDTRADATRHGGDFRKIVEGVNNTLDAVIGPLNVAAEYVERIGRGEIPKPITDKYNGDFNEIKNNLNNCIDGLQGLVECNNILQRMAVNDQTKGVEGDYVGIYASMGEATNKVRDRVLNVTNVLENIAVGNTSRLEELKKIERRSEQDRLMPAIIEAMENVNILIEDTEMLSKAAVEGNLNIRADVSRNQGEYRKIIEGINYTLDAVISPLNDAIRVSNEFSNGNFTARFDEKLHVEGDFVNFKYVLNNIGVSVSEILRSAQSVTMQVAEHSHEASIGADEVAMAAGNVAMSSQKSSELTRELLYKIKGINREIIDLSASNEKIADSSKKILSDADEIVSIGKDAQALGRDTNHKMGSIEKIAKESVDGINSLTEQIKQIDGVLQLINDITSQINLLSLNAAIEAARAGEHGRGFAVVAGEVKNLAAKARNATEIIEKVIISVQRDNKKTADAINTANVEIIDGVNSVNKTLDALNTIIKNATQVTKDIGDITKAIDDQANISLKVVKASKEGNVMTQEVQKEAEGLAAIAQETSASIQEIGAAIHEVSGLSGRLKSELEVYVV